MDPLTALAIGTGAVSVLGSVYSGAQQASFNNQQAAMALGAAERDVTAIELEQKQNENAALAAENARREELDRALGAQKAAAAAMGISLDPNTSFATIQQADTAQVAKEIEQLRRQNRLGYQISRLQVGQTRSAARDLSKSYKDAGKSAYIGGLVGAAQSLFNTVYPAVQTYTPEATSPTKKMRTFGRPPGIY